MNTAVASKSSHKVTTPVPKQRPGARKPKQGMSWTAIAIFLAFLGLLAFLFTPNTPKVSKDSVKQQTQGTQFNNFGKSVIGK